MRLSALAIGIILPLFYSNVAMGYHVDFSYNNDGINATPQETYDEINGILTSRACGGGRVQVGYEHPYLSIEYWNGCTVHFKLLKKINVTIITSTGVDTSYDGVAIYFRCSDICSYSWSRLAHQDQGDDYNDTLHRETPTSYGEIWIKLDVLDATRVAKALKHFGLLYRAGQHRDKFD